MALDAATDAQTGTMVIKTWADGQIEYIPVTVSMLQGSFDVNTAGVYRDLNVVYNGVTVGSGYTLTVGDAKSANAATISVPEGYYYRLTNQFKEGNGWGTEHRYLILNRNAIGEGKLMESKGYGGNSMLSTDVIVTLDADGVPSVQSKYLTTISTPSDYENKNSPIRQEWWYHKESNGNYYLWQPNWDGGNHTFLRIATPTKGNVVGGDAVNNGVINNAVLTYPKIHLSTGISNYITVQGTYINGTTQHSMYIEYDIETQKFMGVNEANRTRGQEVYYGLHSLEIVNGSSCMPNRRCSLYIANP